MYRDINYKHINKRKNIKNTLEFPFYEGTLIENVSRNKMIEMLNVMEFEKEEMTPKHKANLNYGFIKYRLYDKQKEAYREEEPNSLLRVMFELDTFITDYGFFEEDNCW